MKDNEHQEPPKKLKPVILPPGPEGDHYAQNTTQQQMLLKAMQVTNDPKKLKEMIGVRTVAEVYRTLDKMAIRKEFHQALDRAGISFDFIVKGIKDVAETSEKSGDRLKAFQILLQTLGLDKYEQESSQGGGSWEDLLLKAADKEGEVIALPEPEDYEVTLPVVPEAVQARQAAEKKASDTFYDKPVKTDG